MTKRLIVLMFVAALSAPAHAICVKCVDRNCQPNGTTGYVNCMSNGRLCEHWTVCDGGGGCTCGMLGCDMCEQGALQRQPQWRITRVEVQPAKKVAPRYVVAAVTITTLR